MTLNRPKPHPLPPATSTKTSSPSASCQDNTHLLTTIQNAVRDNYLGQALQLLTDNPLLQLPEHTVEELAAKLRVRGLPHQTDLIGNRLQPTASSTAQFLSRSHVNTAPVPSHSQSSPQLQPPPSSSLQQSVDIENIIKQPSHLQSLLQNHLLDESFSHLSSISNIPTETIDNEIITSDTLETLIQLSVSKGQLKKAQHVLDVFFPKFATLPTAPAYAAFIDACGRVGSIHRAFSVVDGPGFSLLDKSDQSTVYCTLVDACVRCGALPQADAAVERMRKQSIPVTEPVYIALLNASSRSFSFDRSLRILSLMRRDGLSPRTVTTYNAILQGAARAGRIHDAFRVFNTMMSSKSVTPDLDSYNALLVCCNRAGDPDRAFQVLDMMCDDGYVYPNAKSYNWAVAACARVGDVDRALQVARRMRREGIRINIVTHNNLLEACCNAGRLERAFSMVKDMIQRQGIEPNSHTYNALIKGCGRWGMVDAALRLLSSMQSAGVSPTVITYSVAIDACARAGGAVAVDRAFGVLSEMERAGLEPNVVTFNSLIHACAQGKDVKLAFEVFDRMIKSDVTPDIVTLCSLVDACGRAGQLSRALEVIENIPRKFPSLRPNVPAYNALMHACSKAGDLARMECALSDMKKRSLKPSVVTFSTLISAYAANGDVARAQKYLNLMRESGLRPNRITFTSLVAAYGRSGHVDLAMDMLNEARKSCGQPDEELFTAAIVTAVRGEKKELAIELKDEMSRAGYFVPTVLNRMMRRVGEVDRSGAELRRVLNAMEALKIRPQRAALESLISAYSKEADVRSAFDVLPDMERLGYPPNIQTYKKLIQASALSGKQEDITQARSLFDMVRSRVTDGDPQLISHNWVELYEAILRACYQLPDGGEKTKTVSSLLDRMSTDCGDDNVKMILSRFSYWCNGRLT